MSDDLYGHYIFLFGGYKFVHALDFFVCDFLNLGFSLFLCVFRKPIVLLGLLQEFDAVASCIAHYYLGVLSGSFGLLDKFLSSLFRQGRHGAADGLSVVLGSESEVGIDDGFFDFGNHALFPRLQGKRLGVRC